MLRKTAFYLALLCLAASAWADTAAGVAAFRNRQFDLAWRELSGPAEAGDPVAQTYLGTLLASGVRGRADMEGAVRWYRKAAAQNHGPALSQLGMMYVMGYGVRQDFPEAVKLFERGVALGNRESMTNLAQLYETGQGVPRDAQRAAELKNQAAKLGERVAQEQNARDHATRGEAEFRQATTLRSTRQFAESHQMAERAAAMGHVDAMVLAGRQAVFAEGTPRDYAAAMRYSRAAADAGNATGMFQVGYLYEFGLGVPMDRAQALRWYDRAAAKGDRIAAQSARNLRSPDYDPPPAGPARGGDAAQRERACLQAGGAFNGLGCSAVLPGGGLRPCASGSFGAYNCPAS